MREVSLFWKRARLKNLDIAEILTIFKHLEFISYVKRVPKDVRIILKANFCEGKTVSDIDDLYFLDLLEVIMEPREPADSYLILVRLNHSLSNLNARTNGTSAAPGCRLDGEGLTYVIQGPPMKLRIVTTLARIMSKPDRTSARSLDFNLTADNSLLSPKQLKLAKFAYDKGFFDVPKRIRVSDLAEQIGLARATISEHLARIEAIIMDDMFSSFDDPYVPPETIKLMLEAIELDSEEANNNQKKGMKKMLETIRDNIKNEISPQILHNDNELTSLDEMVELGMQEHQQNISQIDQILEEKFSSLN
ncbi:MAG: helix-turn-helix domain-containing protein [Candidatus Poseidoniaceae archaeon]|nr:helix-turn-helix domain-containing protein [Candidatus Poseidoniaceae archaeon]